MPLLAIYGATGTGYLSALELRRHRLLKGIEEQLSVVDSAISGQPYSVSTPKWITAADGVRTAVTRQRVVRAWFKAQDGGFYVQCRYGNKALQLGKGANAVFVKALHEVKAALQTLYAAAAGGELDAELCRVAAGKPKRV